MANLSSNIVSLQKRFELKQKSFYWAFELRIANLTCRRLVFRQILRHSLTTH